MLRTNIRTRHENIIKHLPGVKTQIMLKVFISNEIFKSVVKHTNANICLSGPQPPDGEFPNVLYKKATAYEMKAVFGLLFLARLIKIYASHIWKQRQTARQQSICVQ